MCDLRCHGKCSNVLFTGMTLPNALNNVKHMTCSADAPTKTNLNGKVLARLRSTAGTNLVTQTGLARSSSSLSGDLQLATSSSISPVPSIGGLGSMAAGPPQLNRLAPAVGLGAARRSADLPLQQLMGMQTLGAPAFLTLQLILLACLDLLLLLLPIMDHCSCICAAVFGNKRAFVLTE